MTTPRPRAFIACAYAFAGAILLVDPGCARRRAPEPPPEVLEPPPPPIDRTIVPGQRIGPFTIGMTIDQVRATGLPGLIVEVDWKRVRLPAYELRLGDDLRVLEIEVTLDEAPPLFAEGEELRAGTNLDEMAERFAPCDPAVHDIGGGGQACRNGSIFFGYSGPATNDSFIHRGEYTEMTVDVTVRAPRPAEAAR